MALVRVLSIHGDWYVDTDALASATKTHTSCARISASDGLNSSVINGAALNFDTTDFDTDGFSPGGNTFTSLTIPADMDGFYLILASGVGSSSQGTTIGVGIAVNNTILTSGNQSVSGPAAINYSFVTNPTQLVQLVAGDMVELYNTSTTPGTNRYNGVWLALLRHARILAN